MFCAIRNTRAVFAGLVSARDGESGCAMMQAACKLKQRTARTKFAKFTVWADICDRTIKCQTKLNWNAALVGSHRKDGRNEHDKKSV